MIAEFQKALACGYDLDRISAMLRESEARRHQARLAEIEQARREAELVRWGMTQPKGSAAFSTARAAVSDLRKKFPESRKARAAERAVLRALEEPDTEERGENHDGKAEQGQPGRNDGSGEDGAEVLSAAIPQIEP